MVPTIERIAEATTKGLGSVSTVVDCDLTTSDVSGRDMPGS